MDSAPPRSCPPAAGFTVLRVLCAAVAAIAGFLGIALITWAFLRTPRRAVGPDPGDGIAGVVAVVFGVGLLVSAIPYVLTACSEGRSRRLLIATAALAALQVLAEGYALVQAARVLNVLISQGRPSEAPLGQALLLGLHTALLAATAFYAAQAAFEFGASRHSERSR